jgi:hypothetical protein
VVFYQLLTEGVPQFAGVRSTRTVNLNNPGKLSLAALPPGKYQFCREVMNHLKDIGVGAMLDRQFFELKPGETKSIQYVRTSGARVRGKVTGPADIILSGIVVSVQSEKAQRVAVNQQDWTIVYASTTTAANGSFVTERIVPGTYRLVAEAYTPLTPDEQIDRGFRGPSYRALTNIDVPVDGELIVPELALQPIAPGK